MATPTEPKGKTSVTEDDKGMRVTLSAEAASWLDDMCKLTGMSRSEFIEESLKVMKDKGREQLAKAIVEKAQAVSKALLESK